MSPSNKVTGRFPNSNSLINNPFAKVDFPEPDNPVKKTVNPLSFSGGCDFLSSIKNSDSFHESEIKYANESYYGAKSIGFWKKQVSEEMYDAYQDFREKVLEAGGEGWLRKNGIEVEWK